MKKILAIFVLVILCSGISYAQKETALQEYSKVSYRMVTNGDVVSAVSNSKSLPGAKSILKYLNTQQNYEPSNISVTFTYIGCSTIYDMLSNGTPQNIVQDPNNLDRIHSVCMYSPPGDPNPGYPGRRTKYYYSTNKGTNWTYVCEIPNGQRSGFCVVCLASNGNALISEHNTYLSTYFISHFNYDAAPGLGSFTTLYPSGSVLMDYHWPRTITTNSIVLPNKFISVSSPGGRDSCFWIAGTSFGPTPGTFSPWHFIYSDQAETYPIARGSDGRIGILYHNNDVLLQNNYGDIFFTESTDNGTTFGTATKIYDANISPTGDSLGHFRGIQLVYQGNVPKAVFEVCKLNTSGEYFPNDGKNHIRFWSTSLPGSDPNRSIKIADTGSVGYHPLINTFYQSSGDVQTCICRPTIGVSSSGNLLYVAFMVPSNFVGGSVDTVSFKDVWFMYSTNSGLNWVPPVKINPVSPIRDWSYPSLSPVSDYSGGNYFANLLMLSDSIPGSHVNFPNNGESNAKFIFARINVFPSSVNSVSTEIPNEYRLYQNYPNPFNPTTKIKFQIPAPKLQLSGATSVKLMVYDIRGKITATLINEEMLPGTYEVNFSGGEMPSGIYFYMLQAENFRESKRMILIK